MPNKNNRNKLYGGLLASSLLPISMGIGVALTSFLFSLINPFIAIPLIITAISITAAIWIATATIAIHNKIKDKNENKTQNLDENKTKSPEEGFFDNKIDLINDEKSTTEEIRENKHTRSLEKSRADSNIDITFTLPLSQVK